MAITPLYSALYSQKAPGFQSEKGEIKAAIATVSAACGKRGVWVLDRGGDRAELNSSLLAGTHAFIIRNTGVRHVLAGRGTLVETAALAARSRNGCRRLDYGFCRVRLPDHPDVPLGLVLVRDLGARPMMLLTNLPMRRNHKALWWAVSAYLSCWRIERRRSASSSRATSWRIRVLSYERLRNMTVLVNAFTFFIAVVLGTRIKLEILASHLPMASKCLFGIPDFRRYAIADGNREVCARSPRRSNHGTNAPTHLTILFG